MKIPPPALVSERAKVADFYAARSRIIPPLPWTSFAPPFSGNDFIFSKVNGEPYLEVHHLVPLGEGGSDDPTNLVVISAHMHRMLHYAVVEGIDLTKIVDDKLDFTINGESFTITWLPEHAKVIADAGGATA